MTKKEIDIRHDNRKVRVNYLDLSPTEVKVQHALGTALWHVHCFKLVHFIIPVIAPNPMAAIKCAEQHHREALAYQVDEVLTDD